MWRLEQRDLSARHWRPRVSSSGLANDAKTRRICSPGMEGSDKGKKWRRSHHHRRLRQSNHSTADTGRRRRLGTPPPSNPSAVSRVAWRQRGPDGLAAWPASSPINSRSLSVSRPGGSPFTPCRSYLQAKTTVEKIFLSSNQIPEERLWGKTIE